MAKIAFFNFTPVIVNNDWKNVCYYEGLIKSFLENGNDVYQFVTNEFLIKPWNGSNEAVSKPHKEEVLAELKAFNPDFIISFNHSFIEDADKVLDCPIILWEADAPKYFSDQDYIKKNIDRYLFFAFSEFVEMDFKNRFGASENQVFRIRNATAVQAEKIAKKQNISFIGSCFENPIVVVRLFRESPQKFFDFLKLCDGQDEKKIENLIQNSDYSQSGLKTNHIIDIRTSQKRLQTLSAVADLGLAIWGDSKWQNQYTHSIDLALSYDDRLAYSLEHNQDIYNKSKVSINVSHAQAITGYPWRVLDILASDSVLVSDSQKDLIDDFGKDVSLQLYNNPFEAREICRKIIIDDSLRNDIIAQQNEAINKNYRWEQRFAEIERILKVSLLNNPQIGTLKKFKLQNTKQIDFAYKTIKCFFDIRQKISKIRGKSNKKSKFSLLKSIWDKSPNVWKYASFKLYCIYNFKNKPPHGQNKNGDTN